MIANTSDISAALYEEVYEEFPSHSIYHTHWWHQFLHCSFGWRVQALTVRSKGKLELFLPYVSKRGITGKRRAVALPLSHHVPLLIKEGIRLEAPEVLTACGSPLEVKSEIPGGGDQCQLVVNNDLALLDLSRFGSEDELFSALHKSSIQRKIRKAEREGVRATEATTDQAFETFYDMEVETRMRQGSPIYPSRFFRHLKETFSGTDKVKLFMAYADGKPAAGIIFLFHGDTAIYAYGGSYSNPDWFKLGVNQAAMWKAVQDSFARGYRTLDFGTSPRSQPSLLDYKLKWGAQKVPLATSFILPKGVEPPVINRDGLATRMISSGIRSLPKPLFKQLTPILLKLAV